MVKTLAWPTQIPQPWSQPGEILKSLPVSFGAPGSPSYFLFLGGPVFGLQLHRILDAEWDGLAGRTTLMRPPARPPPPSGWASAHAVGILHKRYKMTTHLQAHRSCQVHSAATYLSWEQSALKISVRSAFVNGITNL